MQLDPVRQSAYVPPTPGANNGFGPIHEVFVRKLFSTQTICLLLSVTPVLLTGCGRDADVKNASVGVPAPQPQKPVPPPVEVPFQSRLSDLEKSESCGEASVAELIKINAELKELYGREMHGAVDLTVARGVDQSLAPYFLRVKKYAASCVSRPGVRAQDSARIQSSGLLQASTQDSAAEFFARDSLDSCSAPELETMVLALVVEGDRLSPNNRLRLRKALSSCGIENDEKLEEAKNKIALVDLHSKLSRAAPCSLDSRYFADESGTNLENEFPSLSRPAPGSKILAAQLRVDIARQAATLATSCEPNDVKEPALVLQSLESELNDFDATPNRCHSSGVLETLLSRARQGEAQDKAKLLSSRMKQEFQQRYIQLQTRISTLQQSCSEKNAEEKRQQEEERKRLEEEKKKQEEQKKEEERKEAERKRAEEQQRKEEERKRLEEEKRKQEEQKKEEERKKLEEKKRIEEEKRKEAERKRLEEQQRKEEERKRLEEEKRKQEEQRKKIEEEKQRREEEKRRAEQEKYRSVEEKRLKLVPPAWGDAPARKPWTAAVLSVVRARMSEFDRAADADTFCPGYTKAALHERENCWLMLVSGVSQHESNFKTGDSFTEGNGQDSVGLLALSAGECPNAMTAKALTNPIQNLICGTNIMARLVGMHGIIDGSNVNPKTGKDITKAKGASAYWSTLRPAYRVYHPGKDRWLNVGHKLKVMVHTKRYKNLR